MTGVVMSMGAGFYEELAFRVVLFGLGAKVLVWLVSREKMNVVDRDSAPHDKGLSRRRDLASLPQATFSGVHYLGPFGTSWSSGRSCSA